MHRIPTDPCTLTHNLHPTEIRHQSGAFVTIDKPTLTHRHTQSPQFTVGFTLGALQSMGVTKVTCIPHCSIQNSSLPPKLLYFTYSSFYNPNPLANTEFFAVSIVLLYLEHHIVGITVCSFFNWLLSP